MSIQKLMSTNQVMNQLNLCMWEKLICYVEFKGGEINIQDSFWYPEFGKELCNKRLLIELLDKKLTTNISYFNNLSYDSDIFFNL